jgi:hypothetical protein
MRHKFVEYIPEELSEGILYVSMQFGMVVHKCCCGCGQEVVTPITPTDWKLMFDGESITLSPSIGNWNFKCRSHYFIRKNEIEWCDSLNNKQVLSAKSQDTLNKKQYFEKQTNGNIFSDLWIKIKCLLGFG